MTTSEKIRDKLDLARLHVEEVFTTLKKELGDYSKTQIQDNNIDINTNIMLSSYKDQLERIEKLIKDLKKVII